MTEFKLSTWQKIYYPCYRFANRFNLKDRYRDVKWFILRGKNGWATPDAWSADYYLYKIIPPMLRQIADGMSYPGLPPYDTPKKWSKALLGAADDIEAYYLHDEAPFPTDKKGQTKYFADRQKAIKRTEQGIQFVADNFFDLWD